MAVTTFVSREGSLLRSCWIGLFWGVGHTLSLALAGTLHSPFKINLSDRLSGWLEVGGRGNARCAWGPRAVSRLERQGCISTGTLTPMCPGKAPHVHWHLHASGKLDEHAGWLHFGLRPLVVGMVHGAAGTGALMLLVLSTISSSPQALLYIVIFGIGSVAGMLIVSLLLAIPLQWAARNVASGYRIVQAAAGVFSCVIWDLPGVRYPAEAVLGR